MGAKGHRDPLAVECPKCRAPKGEPCVVLGTLTGEEPEKGQFAEAHRARRDTADSTPKVLIKAPKIPTCKCTNHMGAHKSLYRTQVAAVQWAARSPRVRGMRMEPYRCPTSDGWHLRTPRQMAGGVA